MYSESVPWRRGFPCRLGGVILGRGRNAEVLVIVVGHDYEPVALMVDGVIVPLSPRRHQDRFGCGVVRRDQSVLGGNMVAGPYDHVFIGVGVSNPHENPGSVSS